jgi:hypothetical protein
MVDVWYRHTRIRASDTPYPNQQREFHEIPTDIMPLEVTPHLYGTHANFGGVNHISATYSRSMKCCVLVNHQKNRKLLAYHFLYTI